MGKKCCNLKCGLITAGVIGAILVIIGGIAVVVYDVIFENIVEQEGTIKEGTIMYDQWSVVTTPTYMSYYFYNVTNPDAFNNQDGDYIPPIMKEIGPYTYREYYVKDEIEFLSGTDPEEVSFRQKVNLYFEPTMSVGSPDDMITTLNVVGASIPPVLEYLLNNIPKWVYDQLDKIYNETHTKLLFTKSVNDLLFGFEDPLYSKIVDLFAELNVKIPSTYGLFATSNDSRGWFNYQVYTGKNHPELINIITKYRNKTKLDYWNSALCNMINGTDGTTTPPFMKKEDKIYFFVDDVCRSLYATFDEEVVVKRIPAWKYSIPPEVFGAPETHPENECYCLHPGEPACKHDGAILLESCQSGAPVLISSPHFLYGDGYYLNQTVGVSPPVQEEHEAALVYEPNTGSAIKVDKRLQMNFLLVPNENIPDPLNRIRQQIAFPVLWLNESGELVDDDADLLYGLLVVPEEAVSIIQIVFCIVGGILVLAPLVFLAVSMYGKNHDKQSKVSSPQSAAPQMTRFSSSGDNDVFEPDFSKPAVYKNVNGNKHISTTSKSELIQNGQGF